MAESGCKFRSEVDGAFSSPEERRVFEGEILPVLELSFRIRRIGLRVVAFAIRGDDLKGATRRRVNLLPLGGGV
jgi:hypothetical protein